MLARKKLQEKVLNLKLKDFEATALEVFHYQFENNQIYQNFVKALDKKPEQIQSLRQIPFLPIEFFKSHTVASNSLETQKIFESSATTSQVTSKHFIKELVFYEKLSLQIFEQFYGNIKNYHILALLPSYLERDTSSLVYMVQHFIQKSQSKEAGFYLNNPSELIQNIQVLQKKSDRKVLLLGVTFALLDLAENYDLDLSKVIVMETGGMKGRRKEMIRAEVHQILKQKLNLAKVHSEYGMTELLSQAYSLGDEIFELPKTMRIILRNTYDPLEVSPELQSGVMNIIDLGNIDSCAFIATQDLAQKETNNAWKILGRVDNSDIRGCNLMYF